MANWEKLTGAGQIKQGDKILLSFDGEAQIHFAEDILNKGTNIEEILINKKENLYFITSMAVDGTSWAKNVKYLKSDQTTREHIVDAVYEAVDRLGSQKNLCDEIGISGTALSLFLTGDRNPPYALLAYLGYGQKTVYYKLKED